MRQVALRALQGLVYMRHLLDPRRYPLASFCVISHKVLRYLIHVSTDCPPSLTSGSRMSSRRTNLLIAHILYMHWRFLGCANLPQWMHRLTVIPSYFSAEQYRVYGSSDQVHAP